MIIYIIFMELVVKDGIYEKNNQKIAFLYGCSILSFILMGKIIFQIVVILIFFVVGIFLFVSND
jgi:hypothetical protein